MDPLLGTIMLFAGNFAPRNWSYCEGQLIAISSNSALFSILGTTYGGDGRTTFALPDLRGRVAVGPRRGPGLSTFVLGERGGVEEVVLNTLQLPSHTHLAQVAGSVSIGGTASGTISTSAASDSSSPDGKYPAPDPVAPPYGGTKGTGTMASDAVAIDTSGLTVNTSGIAVTNLPTGGQQGHNNMQPYLAINYIIATVGIYPSRN